jgi:putative oxidoreductase
LKRLSSRDYAVFYLRVAVGLIVLVLHGWARIPRLYRHLVLGQPWTFVSLVGRIGFPAPSFFAVASGLAESLGAALIILGLFTRPAAAVLAFNMATALFFELKKGEGGAELPAIYLLAVVGVLIGGSGPFSLDAMRPRFGRRKK